MPGRSCVALTLLISSLKNLRFRKFRWARNAAASGMTSLLLAGLRYAGALLSAGADIQYKGPASRRSIVHALRICLEALALTIDWHS